MKPGYVYFKEDYEFLNKRKARRGDLTYFFRLTDSEMAECFWHDNTSQSFETMRYYPPSEIIESIDLSKDDIYFYRKRNILIGQRFKYDAHLKSNPYLLSIIDKATNKRSKWYYISDYFLPQRFLTPASVKCICDIPTLMARGCQCGGN